MNNSGLELEGSGSEEGGSGSEKEGSGFFLKKGILIYTS